MKISVAPAGLSVLALALVAAFPLPASAQSPHEGLDPVVVTATRTESREDALLSDVVVIGRDAIERHAGRTLAELITREAGVQMSGNGGLGKNSSVYIRGTESRHVLLLIDGVRFGSATAGSATFDNLSIEDIERIEVLKGPASALYGSDAVGGVIQIFTRKGRTGLHPDAAVTVGSHGHRAWTAGVSAGTEQVNYALSVRQLREDGFSSTNPALSSSYNADRDGFEQDSLNASLDWRLAPGWKADARLMHADGLNQYDGGTDPFDVRADVRSQLLALGLEGRPLDAWKSRLAFGRSRDESTNYTSTSTSRFDTQQDQWLWQNEIDTPLGELLAGYEHLVQEVDSTTAYAVTERTIRSWFGGIKGATGAHSWQANLRRDDNSQFGEADTWLLAYGFRLSPNWRMHASRGTSFKAPSFNQLYWPGFGTPVLQPERGRNTEVGTTFTAGAHQFGAVRFDNRIRGFITATTTAANIPQARIEGWTLSYQGQFGGLHLGSALDLLDARNVQNGRKLPRRADRQLTANADYRIGDWKLGGTLLAASERFDNATNTTRLPGFGTVDLHVDYALSRDWSVQARLVNVGDKTYETARGYNQPGRAGYLTLRWQPR